MKKKLFQEYLILVPHQEDYSRVKEHLRYWPYVKAYSGQEFIIVRILLGHVANSKERAHYVSRSCELIFQCLHQYLALVSPRGKAFSRRPIRYKHDLFLRPDDQLKDFRTFIDELDTKPSTH